MQQNINMDYQGKKSSPQQSTASTCSAIGHQNFPPRYVNPRFSVTPNTMGMNLDCENQASSTECRQPVHEPPLVDVKSYYERYDIKQLAGNLSELQLERNTSYHSTQSNKPNSSYASIKSQYNTPRLTPQTSPNTIDSSQQWSFDNLCGQQKEQIKQPEQTINKSSTSLDCETQGIQQSTIEYTSGHFPSGAQVYNTARKPSEEASVSICSYKSPACSRQQSASTTELPTSYFEQQLRKYHTGSDVFTGDSAKINYGTLNNIFLKRLQDIDANACGDKDLKLITFQEWVDMLLKINDSFIINMEELEKEVAERLELVQKKVNTKCRYSQGNELMKCRKDIETLLKILKNVCQNNNSLDLSGITFETINPTQIFTQSDNLNMQEAGASKDCDSETMERNKLLANNKALVYEVAEKHDEVRELKRQIICLEDEIQKAQQKIQLKDDVIKELRNDLKCANHKLSLNNQLPELAMPPINFETETARSANTQISDSNTLTDENNSQFDSLSNTEYEQQKIKVLEKELNEFFEISRELNKQKMERQRKRLMDMFQKTETEKAMIYRRLDFMRRQLINLESNHSEQLNDCDSGFDSKSENDQDAKILNAVRKRLRKLSETNLELKKKVQKLEMENSELSSNLQSEKNFAQRNSETLKEVADLLGGMTTQQFSYTDIYNKTSNEQNPFCEAIEGMKKSFQEREEQLLRVVGIKNQQIEELLIKEKQFVEARASHMNRNDLKGVYKTAITTTPSLSSYTPVQLVSTVTVSTTANCTTTSSSLTDQHLDSMISTFHKDS